MEEDEIKVGDYIRTKNGIIAKCKEITTDTFNYHIIFDEDPHFLYGDKIVKNAQDIIDLIEPGDYVNGERVIDISERGLYIGYEKNVYDEYSRIFIDKDDIKSIVTKEQFKNIEYKVEE